jgi:dTDP-4-dehydrorhamnose reductase
VFAATSSFTPARRPKVQRLLVTGIDYPLGGNLALALSDRWDVLGLSSSVAIESSSLRTARCDANDRAGLEELALDWRPQWIVHCGPLSVASWEQAPSPTLAAEEPQSAAGWAVVAATVGARLTVLSSDVVFAGPRMFHEETSIASSPAPRAAAVREMERALEPTTALIVRTHAYGWSPVAAHAGCVEHFLAALRRGGRLAVDGRRHATPILATDLAELLARAFELRLQGIYHLAGAERTSPFRFAVELAAAFGLPCPLACADLPEITTAAWHEETSLNSKRARRILGMATPMLREGLSRFAEQSDNGWRERWRIVGRAAQTHEAAA